MALGLQVPHEPTSRVSRTRSRKALTPHVGLPKVVDSPFEKCEKKSKTRRWHRARLASLTMKLVTVSLAAVSMLPFLGNGSSSSNFNFNFSSQSKSKSKSEPTTTARLRVQDILQNYTLDYNLHRPHFVIRDFARRVLSRHIVNSSILVVGADLLSADTSPENINIFHWEEAPDQVSLSAIFASHAVSEGHSVHILDTHLNLCTNIRNNETVPFTLDDWWRSFDDDQTRSLVRTDRTACAAEIPRWWSSSKAVSRPSWVLSAVFDAPFGQQDSIWRQSTEFLQESTVTYMIVAIHSKLTQNDTLLMDGVVAAKALLHQKYKLQVLLVSHYHADEYATHDTAFDKYGPNALLRTQNDVEELLRWGARGAQWYGGHYTPFKAYVFATQGLDLAIPSVRVYLTKDSPSSVQDTEVKSEVSVHKPLQLQLKPCPQAILPDPIKIAFGMLDGTHFLTVGLRINGTKTQQNISSSKISAMTGYNHSAHNKSQSTVGASNREIKVWYNGEDVASSEAACLAFHNRSKCTTRIIPESPSLDSSRTYERPNILLLLIDPISRGFFERSMPLTRQKLRNLNFVHFSNFTSVGPNSGPNQAALYSGIPLTRRDGIGRHSGRKWLWDRLRESGYKTLKGEDGCIENSNMVQSLKPNTTHGEALHRLFCFDFDRPNCIGPDLASGHLLTYGEQFVKTYQGVAPWAGFLHFVDTHEDTMVLSLSLDSQVPSFLDRLQRDMGFENTVVIVCSDHGLHYGPYFQARSGREERSQPLLYIRIPTSLQPQVDMDAFAENSKLWTTAFDLHETMVQLTSTGVLTSQGKQDQELSRGRSLFQSLPAARGSCDDTVDIPDEYCAILEPESSGLNQCTRIPNPPSVLSFFADIPSSNRPKFKPVCASLGGRHPSDPSLFKVCECATSHRDWYMCTGHPWGTSGVYSKDFPKEHFALMKCQGEKLSIDTRVIKHRELVSSVPASRGNPLKPNILLVEMDSVSNAYADRHFPLTRRLLNSHKPRRTKNGGVQCDGEICAVNFNLFGLLGPDPDSNLIPVLSGCLVARFHSDCFVSSKKTDPCSEIGMFTPRGEKSCKMCPTGTFLKDPLSACHDSASNCCTDTFEWSNATKFCRNPTNPEGGLQLFRRGPRSQTIWCPPGDSSPFLFDVAKEQGYLTLFAQEVCGDSPHGSESDNFPLRSDIDVQKLYCRAKERFGVPVRGAHVNQCSKKRSATEKSTDSPVMDHIRGMWDSYPEQPKFAYVNEVTSYDHSQDWIKTISGSEAYDLQLLELLLDIFDRSSFSDTIIILRSNSGVHNGPATLEYSTQVEHRDPWTQIVFSQKSKWVSTKIAADNQDRLANGFDLYRTVRDLMRGSGVHEAMPGPAIPGWSYNILNSPIPTSRTCVDARIPVDFCPCAEEVGKRPPSYGVCNPFDPYSDRFCMGD